jgi:hypothetical protein
VKIGHHDASKKESLF